MASIRVNKFSGLLPEVDARLLPPENGQIAHNCILTDGSLRPQAAYLQLKQGYGAFGIGYDWATDRVFMTDGWSPVTLTGEPFKTNRVVAAQIGSELQEYQTGAFSPLDSAGVPPFSGTSVIDYSRSYDSNKPVNRLYAATIVRKTGNYAEESILTLLENDPEQILYEGDLVTITLMGLNPDPAMYVRIYRSISGLDNGQTIANVFDTQWHLAAEIKIISSTLVYSDGASATALPLDMAYSGRMHPMEIHPRYIGLTESGWFTAVSEDGEIQISERYMHHAWPVENHLAIDRKVEGCATQMDNIFIGSEDGPYIAAISMGENATQVSIRPYTERLPCMYNSMTPAPAGALYTSRQGVVSLSREGLSVLTKNIANASSVLLKKTVPVVENPDPSRPQDYKTFNVEFSAITHGRYFNGQYFAFCEAPRLDLG